MSDVYQLPPIMSAACRGDMETLKRLVVGGADVNVVDKYGGATALHKACQGGILEAVKLLLDAGAFINATVHTTGHTALAEAIWFKHVDVVKYLLDNDCALNIPCNYGFDLMEHLAYELEVNKSIPEEYEKLARVKRLIDERVTRDQGKLAEYPLLGATLNNDVALARRLLDERAEPDVLFPVVNGFNDGHTPLLVACRDDKMELAQLLIEHGANVNAVEPVFGAVPLHKATYNGRENILALLLQQSGIDVDFVGYTNGYTPLHDALWHGFEGCATQLLDHGVRLDIEGHDGKLALDIAREVFGADAPITRRIASMM